MKPYARADRVSGQIQKELADVLQKEIRDPRLTKATVTGVRMSADLRQAKIYFATAGDARANRDAGLAFASARGYLKRLLAQRLELRYMPDLKFFYDESFDYGAHIEALLKTVKQNDNETHH